MLPFLKHIPPIIVAVLLIGVGGVIGWRVSQITPEPSQQTVGIPNPLRLKGYQFISPLLLCDTKLETNLKKISPLQQQLQDYLRETVGIDNQTRVAIYFRSLSSGEEFAINPEQRFNPASIKKIPLVIQLFKESETNPTFLSEKGVFNIDDNSSYADITSYVPEEKLVSGNEYSIEQLIMYMIKYSDNVSYNILVSFIGIEKAEQIYKDMALYFENPYGSTDEYISPYQVSLFFRLLYNATYLSKTNSEKVLKMLSEVNYKNALEKKLPAGVLVSHKFGIVVNNQLNGKEYGELHDCGITYKENNPYILCVMTDSKDKDITAMEDMVATISSLVYQY